MRAARAGDSRARGEVEDEEEECTMKATQEMYDAAYKAFDCGSDTIAAAVDAALALVPAGEELTTLRKERNEYIQHYAALRESLWTLRVTTDPSTWDAQLKALIDCGPRAPVPATGAFQVTQDEWDLALDYLNGEAPLRTRVNTILSRRPAGPVATCTREELAKAIRSGYDKWGAAYDNGARSRDWSWIDAVADAAARALGVTLSDAPVSVPEGYQYASAADALRPGDRHGLVASANPSEIPNSSDLAGAVRHIARYCAWNRKAARDEALALLGVPASAPAADAATTGERPKVGEVVSWERAKADMVAHPEARYGDSPHDPRPYRVHGGMLQWWQHDQWCDENTPDQGDQVRLLDAGAAPASDGLAERVARLERGLERWFMGDVTGARREMGLQLEMAAGGGRG